MNLIQSIETASGPRYVEYAAAEQTSAEPAIDMHDVIKTGNIPDGVVNPKSVAKSLLDVDTWLPFAAETYGISANLRDMIVVPTTIFLTDIPNANLAAFPFEEMSAWSTQAGCVTYKSWKGKPTFREHANDNPSIAAGVIFDASMRAVPNYLGGLHRVVLLNGWDRNRYPDLAKTIEAGRSGFSMGCWVNDYTCGVCSASLKDGGCDHIHPKLGVRMKSVGNKLVYRIARGAVGFECSSVKNPAFRSAWGVPID